MSTPVVNSPNPLLEEAYLPELPPTQDELPYDDGVPMETWRHKCQMDLLITITEAWLQKRSDGFVSGNMFLYYSLEQSRVRDFKGPDYFVVLGVPKGERKSWVIWEQGKGPDVVIELLSQSTAQSDKTHKKKLYEQTIRVPEYFWFDPFAPEDWAGFRLLGSRYEPIEPDGQGRLKSETLGLYLVKWQGSFRGIETTWIRWATESGELLPTEAEEERQSAEQERQRAEQERQRAEQERQRAETAEQRAERLAQKLRELGVDLGTLS
ncbi:Uma2 family endonuclease [Synechococcus sp. Nb3U1]|uniref:Uma2 family endonuclease n=1 Tax=Synechococcus sp. Nb3U1 TaxID=1914529 RepID=UPI001F1B1E5A|nr:Uma2 family endonuclease [Synechococcus sp. Nb3U1]MCF2971749.1 Uma2 family endonuclease [Synechococcus sp. Nb3U1]